MPRRGIAEEVVRDHIIRVRIFGVQKRHECPGVDRERFDEGVLDGLAGLDELQSD